MSITIESLISNETIDDNYLILNLDDMTIDDCLKLKRLLKKFAKKEWDNFEAYHKLSAYCNDNGYEA